MPRSGVPDTYMAVFSSIFLSHFLNTTMQYISNAAKVKTIELKRFNYWKKWSSLNKIGIMANQLLSANHNCATIYQMIPLVDMELSPVWKSMRNLESNEISPSSPAQKLTELWDFKDGIYKKALSKKKAF